MKFTLKDLTIQSFVTDLEKRGLRAGAVAIEIKPNSRDNCSPLCMPTYWEGCE